jgi:formylglycine-generating enzyme
MTGAGGSGGSQSGTGGSDNGGTSLAGESNSTGGTSAGTTSDAGGLSAVGGASDGGDAGESGSVGAGVACGDGIVGAGESCDDGGVVEGDGCNANCLVEAGWMCAGSPSACNRLSCIGLTNTCGSTSTDDCCSTSVIPGVPLRSFYRSYDGVAYQDKSYPARLTGFRLDTYEITVGRFRKFWAGYPADLPASGSGKNPNDISDSGWDPTWNASVLAVDQAGLTAAIECDADKQTWTAGNDNLPMNCLDWFEAEAFCIWDGGRLPTEAEWDYAAAGGTEQRVYPWGAADPTAAHAVSAITLGAASKPTPVGSKPLGKGKWGQADLAGNVWEWTQDWYASPYANPCDNCANLMPATRHSLRGGGFNSGNLSDLTSSNRLYDAPVVPARSPNFGARCARAAT